MQIPFVRVCKNPAWKCFGVPSGEPKKRLFRDKKKTKPTSIPQSGRDLRKRCSRSSAQAGGCLQAPCDGGPRGGWWSPFILRFEITASSSSSSTGLVLGRKCGVGPSRFQSASFPRLSRLQCPLAISRWHHLCVRACVFFLGGEEKSRDISEVWRTAALLPALPSSGFSPPTEGGGIWEGGLCG